jgi:hypothetical protein
MKLARGVFFNPIFQKPACIVSIAATITKTINMKNYYGQACLAIRYGKQVTCRAIPTLCLANCHTEVKQDEHT